MAKLMVWMMYGPLNGDIYFERDFREYLLSKSKFVGEKFHGPE
jgi:hypothetical protein